MSEKLKIEVNNKSGSPVADSFFVETLEKVLKVLPSDLKKKKIQVSVALVSKREMERLNKDYRGKNCPTDVLSFAEFKNVGEIIDSQNEEVFLGELVLCYDDIEEYALENNLLIEKELKVVTAHGFLHLFGFSHGKEMFSIQEAI